MMRPRFLIRSFKHIQASVFSSSYLHFKSGRISQACKLKAMSTSSRPKVFVTRRVPEDGINLLKEHCEVSQWNSDDAITREELIRGIKGVDALFCLLTDKIDEGILDAAGDSLRAIGTMSVGYDHIDLAACRKRGIPVGYTPDVLTSATAELTVALLLNVSRRLGEGVEAVKDGSWGTWSPLWMCGQGLDGATVGILGLGRIGLAVAQCLKPFGVAKILYSGNSEKDEAKQLQAEFVTFDELLKKSDFVLGCCALTKENIGLMNKEAFSKMKKTAVFINTSRGGLVNQDDLYEALKYGEIFAAGVDVTSPEPLPTDSSLLSLSNCVVLPHIGSATMKARNAMSELCARNIIAALKGNPMLKQVQ
ncbi:GRHPR-like protein [Mya arenaria]|uniref:GRHPR-like protein n=1 Tax=Mya arenaria TaxID=6604 RepID=A0ABY7ENB4_MYAAR|nr:glyoxylate reductase/hydroxypyruvate reductase-like [Mya arenaria]WAR10221.1 GRHPR-like protein [Mya arenaria]